MAYTTINKSTDYFNTKLYSGNYQSHAITGVGFQPDWVWIKERSSTSSHRLMDAVRGVGKGLSSDNTTAEESLAALLTSFDSDGFTVGADNGVNQNNQTYAAWNWKANGAGSANTDGSINTTYTSVNTTAGFSISKYTGTGSNATVGHGLGVAPKMIIFKRLDSADDWTIYHNKLGATKKIDLNNTGASSTVSSVFNDTAPTTSVMSVGTNGRTNASSGTYVAYAFAEKTGYSKFGSYTGNGSTDGPFVYTGFKPAWIMVKATDATKSWYMWDNKRSTSGSNVVDDQLLANTTDSEFDGSNIDILSNGFKFRGSGSGENGSGTNYIYMAFGQSLVGSNNVPCTAR
jgi:hypothetical protein